MKPRVAVLRGGVSDEYDVSLQTGATVLESLLRRGYSTSDVLITKDGTWHIDGYPTSLEKIVRRTDVIWNALHGAYGEDGKVQQLLETLHIPYTGSRPLASALCMYKDLAKDAVRKAGVRVPQGVLVRRGEHVDDVAHAIFQRMGPPYILKPRAGGSSLGLCVARTREELHAALRAVLMYAPEVIIEEYIKGRELVMGAIQTREGATHPLWPFEVNLPQGADVFSHEIKYASENRYAPLESRALGEDIAHVVRKVAETLSPAHYFRVDFILTDRGPYLLEVNTLPGLSAASAFPKMLAQSDISFDEFVDHVIDLALRGK
ncbi:MAG: hypothetical protein A2408_04230 [Candidatus Yonathbacteria bacterium RIFOXYC1_FULL_52_10]|uniref:D-alanine--D-alanine ligase n=1 Tax=Candidatus Yonathbacteria bacterium RIFOXYD1_FULL_52_36 TaxID=1802730 RepID=A0A1G2SNF4_9BACT|nr:MAG: hypothetical protein A2408_04230 [Candidatus Yonathbacteria bacterium RIFOXYC1_FULL_52_10]OHA86228.1 MAG: hypothetical protein A2591_00405 [Candidatus Yonathbacteria bacterium RIFOXYD1_FULL_52_36]